MPFYDYRDYAEVLRDAQMRSKKATANPADALVAQRLGAIYAKYPYMQTGVALSLAETGADMAMVDQVAGKSAEVALRTGQENADGSKNATTTPYQFEQGIGDKIRSGAVKGIFKGLGWLGGNTLGRLGVLKTASRYTTAALQSIPETVTNIASRATDPERGSGDLTNMLASTSLGALLQHGDEAGSGFFVGGKAEETRLQKVKKFRWQINGESYTIGRGTANMMFKPGSEPYKFLSGVIDGAVNVIYDPTIVGGKAIAGIRAARLAIPAIETVEEISAAAKLAKGTAGLLSTAEQHAIDTSKFFNWMDNSRLGQRIVQVATDETDKLRMLEAFDFRITVDDAARLAAAKTSDEVKGILGEAATRLKDETQVGMVPFASDARQLPASRKIPAYRLRNQSRWLAEVPDEYLVVHGTPEENVKAVKNVANYLKTMKIDPYSGSGKALMDVAFETFSKDGTRVNRNVMKTLFLGDERTNVKGIVRMALENAGKTADEIDPLLENFRSGWEMLRKYAHDTAGLTDDNGYIVHMTSFMEDDELYQLLKDIHPNKVSSTMNRAELEDVVLNLQPGELVNHGPMALSQMLNNVVVLPDPRQLRRLSNNPFFQLTKDGKELGAARLANYLQQEVWRPYALMTVGFMVRNSMDAALRVGLHGISTSNPIDYFMMFLGKRGLGTVSEGELWKSAKGAADGNFNDLADFQRFTRQTAVGLSDDPAKSIAHLVKTGQVAIVEPSDVAYGQGLIDSARLMHASPEQRFYAQIMHLPEDRQRQLFVDWLDSGKPGANQARKAIVDSMRDGHVVANRANGMNRTVATIRNAESLSTNDLVNSWIEIGNKWQVNDFTQMTDEIRTLVAYNDVPVAASEIWDEASVAARSITGARPRPGDLLVEDLTLDVNNPQFRYHRVLEQNLVQGPGGKKIRNYKVIEVVDPGEAMMDGYRGTDNLQRFVKDLVKRNANRAPGSAPIIPERVTINVRTQQATSLPGVSENAAAATRAIQSIPRWFFDNVVTRWESAVDRSPAFKMSYYRAIAENARLLNPREANRLLRNIDMYAKEALPKLYARNPESAREQYIGGKTILTQVRDGVVEATSRRTGVGTVQQLQDYATTRARRDLEDLFFSSANKTNLEDMSTLIAPFGAAWRNVVARYGREVIQDPTRLRKAQLVYQGFADADPDNDGRGFIWRDPSTNEMKFTFPLYGRIARAITGIPGIEYAAPVKRLSAGFSAIPGVGPMVQLAASDVFARANVPGVEDIRKFVTPYGDVGLKSMVPGYLNKALSAILDQPDQLDSVYGSVYTDVWRHLSATGEYDLTDQNDINRLTKDAAGKSRPLTLIRAIAQFVGPTSPSLEYRYKKGSAQYYYTSELINWFRDAQAKNYDTAIPEFLDTFGEDALIYVTGKTKVQEPYKGIDATEQFLKWNKENASLLRDHKETAGYLAPGGTEADFSMPVWSQQIATGMRRRIDPQDQLAAAQYSVGAALVRAKRKSYGPNPTSEQKQEIADYREEIAAKYPGFVTAAVFDAKGFNRMLGNLEELLNDERTKNDPVAQSARKYLDLRKQAYDAIHAEIGPKTTLRAKSKDRVVQLREFLYNAGETLAAKNPDFSRLWQRELSAEVED